MKVVKYDGQIEHCPFCNTKALYVVKVDPPTSTRCRVMHNPDKAGLKCGVAGPIRNTPTEAVEAWNLRF